MCRHGFSEHATHPGEYLGPSACALIQFSGRPFSRAIFLATDSTVCWALGWKPSDHIAVGRDARLIQLARQYPRSPSDQNDLDRGGIAETYTKLRKVHPNVAGLQLHFCIV